MTFYSIADETVVALCRSACVQIASLADGKAIPTKAARRFMAHG
jgi:hypothetical protein